MTSDYFANCTLCPRKCGIDRHIRRGFCGAGAALKAARAGLHYYEEPFISGDRGSAAIFFSGCNLRCIYCQNHEISGNDAFGIEITPERLSEIFIEQQAGGAHNINLVTGTPYIPLIAKALGEVKESQLKIPVIWNGSGYEDVEALKMLEGLVDIWLPDFKTLSPELGVRYMNAADYPANAVKALDWMVNAAKEAEFAPKEGEAAPEDGDLSECGLMKKGVCVRHLVIPGQINDSKNVLKYLYETYGNKIWISLMSQYTPMRNDFSFPELNRKLSWDEYDEVLDYAIDLGIEQCMIQEDDVADSSFIPAFDGTGII